jgi:hypothetical protein
MYPLSSMKPQESSLRLRPPTLVSTEIETSKAFCIGPFTSRLGAIFILVKLANLALIGLDKLSPKEGFEVVLSFA